MKLMMMKKKIVKDGWWRVQPQPKRWPQPYLLFFFFYGLFGNGVFVDGYYNKKKKIMVGRLEKQRLVTRTTGAYFSLSFIEFFFLLSLIFLKFGHFVLAYYYITMPLFFAFLAPPLIRNWRFNFGHEKNLCCYFNGLYNTRFKLVEALIQASNIGWK